MILLGDQVPTDEVFIKVLVDVFLSAIMQLCVKLVDLPFKVYIVFEVLNRDFGLSAVFVAESNVFFTLLVGLNFR